MKRTEPGIDIAENGLAASPGERAARHIPVSLAVWVSLLASLAVYGLFLRHGVAPAVVGYNLVPAERVLGGEVPYRDFLYNYTPGVLWLNALLFKLFGTQFIIARLGVLASKAATALLLLLTSRRYLSGWTALFPVIATLAWIGYGDILKVFPTQYGMPLLLASFLAALRGQESSKRFGAWFLAAGALAGMALLFKHNVGLFTVLAVLASALVPTSSSLDKVRRAAAGAGAALLGFAFVAGGLCAYLWSSSALGPMLRHFARHAVAYSEAKGIALPGPLLLLNSFVSLVVLVIAGAVVKRFMPRACPVYLFAIALGFGLVVVLGDRWVTAGLYRSLVAQVYYLPIYAITGGLAWAIAIYRRKNQSAGLAGVIALICFALAAFIEVFPRSDPDHLVRVLPPSLLLVCAMLVASPASADRPYPAARSDANASHTAGGRSKLILLAVGLSVMAVGVRTTWVPQFDHGFHLRDDTPLTFPRGRGVSDAPREAARLNAVVAYVLANTNEGDAILAVSRKMTCVYFFAGRPDITPLLWFDSAGVSAEYRQQVYAQVAGRRFKLILFGADMAEAGLTSDSAGSPDDEDQAERVMLRRIAETYHIAATTNEVSLFSPND